MLCAPSRLVFGRGFPGITGLKTDFMVPVLSKLGPTLSHPAWHHPIEVRQCLFPGPSSLSGRSRPCLLASATNPRDLLDDGPDLCPFGAPGETQLTLEFLETLDGVVVD